jgi:hypothetical protein
VSTADLNIKFSNHRNPGFAENAEVWNSRVAMLSFVVLYVQELFFGPILKEDQPFASLVSSFSAVVCYLKP